MERSDLDPATTVRNPVLQHSGLWSLLLTMGHRSSTVESEVTQTAQTSRNAGADCEAQLA